MLTKSLVFPLVVLFCYAKATPVGLGTLQFDNLDTNIDDLKYEVEEEDLDDYYDNWDDSDGTESDIGNANDKSKATTKTTGYKKKITANKGVKSNHDVQDLKKFLKAVGIKDDGSYSDNEIYAAIEGIAAEAVGAKGSEERKYKKGTKTRGFHRVHHKDEYKKNKEFYEDDETSGSIKKVGGKALGYKVGGGVGFDKGNFHHNRLKGIFGKQRYLDKGFRNNQYKGYSDVQGLADSFTNES